MDPIKLKIQKLREQQAAAYYKQYGVLPPKNRMVIGDEEDKKTITWLFLGILFLPLLIIALPFIIPTPPRRRRRW